MKKRIRITREEIERQRRLILEEQSKKGQPVKMYKNGELVEYAATR